MATYAGLPGQFHLEDQLEGGARFTVAGFQVVDHQWQSPTGRFADLEALDLPFLFGTFEEGGNQSKAGRVFAGLPAPEKTVPQDTFFGRVYVLPLRIDAGFILSTLNFTLDLYNAYKVQRTFQSFVNNAGAGITITDLPALPTVVEDQDGFTMNLQISSEGPAGIDGTMDFVFDTETVTVTVTGTRTATFPFAPETPVVERLSFLTDVMEHRDGSEQRFSLRDAPRQIVEMVLEQDGRDRQNTENLIFSNQGVVFGLPVWWERTFLTSAISATDTVANVEETDFRDFRTGSNFIVWTGPFDFEVLQLDSLTSMTLTPSSAFEGNFPVGSLVMPVRVAVMRSELQGLKRVVNLQQNRFTFDVVDNERDLADASNFPAFDGRPLLDEDNLVPAGGMREGWTRPLVRIDSGTGEFTVFANRGRSRRASRKGFLSTNMSRLWEVRQLLHFLRGRQQDFWIPSFYEDLTVVADVSSASVTLDVENVGYSLLVRDRQHRNALMLEKTDGTRVFRKVESSSEIDDDTEQLTVDSSWGINATTDEIARVSFLERARLDSDDLEITHEGILGQASMEVPVIGVLD